MTDDEDLELDMSDVPVGCPTITVNPEKSKIREVNPANPAKLGYPATLPIEVALKVAPIKEICQAYDITREQWKQICKDPLFIHDYNKAKEMVAEEGVGFKLKAQMQADALLKTTWNIIHDKLTPSNVRADLIKSTIRWAGYEQAAGASATASGSGFSININFSSKHEPKVIEHES